jgi:putative two-component system response regulator
MQQHTTTGYELLRESPSTTMQLAAEIALTHHECWDGSGYPLGLSGEHIALSGRIVAVADVFDALTTVRPYEPGWLAERARRVIKGESGSKFDPAVVEAFDSAFDSLLRIKRHFDGDEVFAPHTAAAH